MKKLIPKCFNGSISAAITNRGYLLPCCYCDKPTNLASPEIKKIEKVSKIDDVNSIEEILLSDEWQEFANNLENNKGPAFCWWVCGNNKNEKKRETTFYKKNEKTYKKVWCR